MHARTRHKDSPFNPLPAGHERETQGVCFGKPTLTLFYMMGRLRSVRVEGYSCTCTCFNPLRLFRRINQLVSVFKLYDGTVAHTVHYCEGVEGYRQIHAYDSMPLPLRYQINSSLLRSSWFLTHVSQELLRHFCDPLSPLKDQLLSPSPAATDVALYLLPMDVSCSQRRKPFHMPISLCLFTLSFLFVSCAARSVSLTLEKRQPKPLLPNSTRGFPQHLQIHSLEPYNPTGSIADSRSSRLRWTSRYHNVQLYGGLVAVGEYYAKVKIGGQTLRVQIDTGSATLAVPLKECVKCKRGDMRYSLKDSKTGVAQYINCDDDECGADTCSPFGCSRCSASRACCASLDEKKCAFHLRFGDGSGAEGALIYDIMSWGDVDFPVHAGGIMSDSDDFERSQVDGILGMAYPSLACNPSCIKPTFESMLEKHTDMKEMFTICITYDSGKIVLGDYDQSLSSKPIAWVPLDLSDPPSFYSFPLKGNMRIDDNELILPSYSRAIVDSGTTLIVFSRSSFSALKSYLQQHFCHVPGLCDPDSWFRPAHCTRIQDEDRNALPTLVFEVEGFNITLGPSDYLINYASKGRDFWCVGIMKLDSMSGGVDVIFGNTVMKKYVTVYDRENKRVGFAESDANCGLTSRDSVPQSLPVSSPVDPKGNTKGEASSTSENESNAESSSSNTEGATSGSGNASAGNQSNTKKQKHQPRAGSGSVLCAQATNCSACALMKDKCTWDGGSQICVAGEGFPLMCTLDNLADKFVYVIGGAVVATVTLVAIVAIVIRKRNATSEAGGEEQEPLAQSENATREAFALEDGDEEEMA